MYTTKINFNKNKGLLINNNTPICMSNIKKYKKTGIIKKIKDNSEIADDINKGEVYFNVANEVYQSKNILILYYQFMYRHEFFIKNWSDLTDENKNFIINMKEDMDNMHVKVIIIGLCYTYLFFITKSIGGKILVDDGDGKIEFKEIPVIKNLTSGELLPNGEEKNLKGIFLKFGERSNNKILNSFKQNNKYNTEAEFLEDIICNGTYQEVDNNNDDIWFYD